MSWLLNQEKELIVHWLQNNKLACLSADPITAKILWSNNSFQELIGYSDYELQTKTKTQLAVRDSSYDADLQLAQEVVEGKKTQYSVRMQLIPKNQSPIWVDVYYLRYPETGIFKCTLAVIIPLKNGTLYQQQSLEEIMNQLKQLTNRGLIESAFVAIGRIAEKYPKTFGFACLVVLGMAIGKPLFETIQEAINVFRN